MRIEHVKAENLPPLRFVEIENMSDIVIIAGANGSGKTTLRQAIVSTLRSENAKKANVWIEVSATKEDELDRWKTSCLEFQPGTTNQVMNAYLKAKTKSEQYLGNLIQVPSDRSVHDLKFSNLDLSANDPDDAEFPNNYYVQSFKTRWQSIVQALHAKAANRNHKIAEHTKSNLGLTGRRS